MADEKIKYNSKNRLYFSVFRGTGVYESLKERIPDPIYDCDFEPDSETETPKTSVLRDVYTGERYFARLITLSSFSFARLRELTELSVDSKYVVWPKDLVPVSVGDELLSLVESKQDRVYLNMRDDVRKGESYALLFPLREYAEFMTLRRKMQALAGDFSEDLNYENRDAVRTAGALLKCVYLLNKAGIAVTDLEPSRILLRETDGMPLFDFSELFLTEPYLSRENPEARMVYANTYGVQFADPFVMRKALLGEPAYTDERSRDFSVAALLFKLFFGRLPYEGAFLDGTREDFEMARVDKFQKYYATSVFIFDPEDRSNTLSAQFAEESRVTDLWNRCPREIRDAFLRVFTTKNALRETDETVTVAEWLRLMPLLGLQVNGVEEEKTITGGHLPGSLLRASLTQYLKEGGVMARTELPKLSEFLRKDGVSEETVTELMALLRVRGAEGFLRGMRSAGATDFGDFGVACEKSESFGESGESFASDIVPEEKYLNFLSEVQAETGLALCGFRKAVRLVDDLLVALYGEDAFIPYVPTEKDLRSIEMSPIAERSLKLRAEALLREYGFDRDMDFEMCREAYRAGIPGALRYYYDFAENRRIASLSEIEELISEKKAGFRGFLKSIAGTRDDDIREKVLTVLAESGDEKAFLEKVARSAGFKTGRFTEPFKELTGTRSLNRKMLSRVPLKDTEDDRISEQTVLPIPGSSRMARMLLLENGTHILEIRDEAPDSSLAENIEKGDVCVLAFGITKAEYEKKDLCGAFEPNPYVAELSEDLLRVLPANRILYSFKETESGREDLKLSARAEAVDDGAYALEAAARDRAFLDSLPNVFLVEMQNNGTCYPYVNEEGSVTAFSLLSKARGFTRDLGLLGLSERDLSGDELLQRIPDLFDDGIKGITFMLSEPERTVKIPLSSFIDNVDAAKRVMGQTALNLSILKIRQTSVDFRKDSPYSVSLKALAAALQDSVLFVPIPETDGSPYLRENPTVFVTVKAQAVLDRNHMSLENYTRGYDTENLELNSCLNFVSRETEPLFGSISAYTDMRFGEDKKVRSVLCGNYYELTNLIYNTPDEDFLKYGGLLLNPNGLEYSLPLDLIRVIDEILYGKERKTVFEKKNK